MTTLTPTEASDLFRRQPDRFLDVGAGEAAYRVVGTGPDVLFVHGWPVSSATFRQLLPHLVDHVTCHLIDFPSAGSSRFDANTPMSISQHIETVRRVVDLLEFDHVAVVGHDSGGMIARHAMVGDPRLRAMGLINTEPPDPSWRFKSFIASRHLPGLSAGLGWVAGKPRIVRSRAVFGDAFGDGELFRQARDAAAEMVGDLSAFPDIYFAGYTQDALKELAEAHITYAVIAGKPIPAPKELGVEPAAYLNGMGEAAGELRRFVLDVIRSGRVADGERGLEAMDTIFPDIDYRVFA